VNHKRGRPKNRRAGCLLCKNWKMNGAGKNGKEYERPADRRRRLGCAQDLREMLDRPMERIFISVIRRTSRRRI